MPFGSETTYFGILEVLVGSRRCLLAFSPRVELCAPLHAYLGPPSLRREVSGYVKDLILALLRKGEKFPVLHDISTIHLGPSTSPFALRWHETNLSIQVSNLIVRDAMVYKFGEPVSLQAVQ